MRYRTDGLAYTAKRGYYYGGHRYLVDICKKSSVDDFTLLVILILFY
jgi:hypothetical protein